MGAVDSKMSQEHTGLGSRTEEDPHEECLQKLLSLKLSIPLLKASAERTLKEESAGVQSLQATGIDVDSLTLDSASTAALFELYDRWQQGTAAEMSKRQSAIHSSVDAAEALAVKVRQRLLYSSSALKTQGAHLEEVRAVREEVAAMKRELRNVARSYDSLCQRLKASGLP